MMANRSDRRLLTLRCVRALEAVGMSTRSRRADFHQGQGSFVTPITQAGYMTATRFSLPVPHPCTRAGSIYDTSAMMERGAGRRFRKDPEGLALATGPFGLCQERSSLRSRWRARTRLAAGSQ